MKELSVSVIIRTKNRPTLLRQALTSLRNQKFHKFEVVVVEDGTISSRGVINEFEDLNIKYFFANDDFGRSMIGNIGLKMSRGDYINFLDDDDFLLSNHLEVLMTYAEDVLICHSDSYEYLLKYVSSTPLNYKILCKKKVFYKKIDYSFLSYLNLFPIQAVLFHRSLFEKHGGFDEKLDLLEDWDLWIRYTARNKNKIRYIPVITSVYTIDIDRINRSDILKKYEKVLSKRNVEPFNKPLGHLTVKYKLFGFNILAYKFYKKVIYHLIKLRY